MNHIQTLTKLSPQDDLKRTQATPFHFTTSSNNTQLSAFNEVLEKWQTQANLQSNHLTAHSTLLQHKARWWNVVRSVPSVVIQATTSVNLVQHLHGFSDDEANSHTGFALTWSIIVVVLLVCQEWFVHLHKALAFTKRATDADTHARQLRNFSEHITTIAIYQENISSERKDKFIHHHLDELKQMRRDIREQFSLQTIVS